MMHAHIAVGFAAKRIAPRVSLGTLIFAGILIDFISGALLLAGIEHVRIVPGFTAVAPIDLYDYPYSHSLLFALIWSLLFGIAHFAVKRDWRNSLVVAIVAASHWLFDFISHAPDLPIAPGLAPRYGLGLWDHFIASHVVEGALFLGGFALYWRATRARDRIGNYALAGMFVLLCLVFAGSLAGTTPPSPTALAVSIQFQLVYVALAAWIDRHREMR